MSERATGATKARRAGQTAFVLAAVAVAAMVAAVLVGHDWGRPSVATADQVLVERYLEPLRAAGLPLEVDQTCHYRTLSDDEPWHLEVQLTVAADPARVAGALDGTIDVIEGPASDGSWLLQDVYGEPQDGWGAALREDGPGRTRLGAVYNNVDPDLGGNVGWQAVCMFPG